jgi:hypothetical protein
VTRPGCYGEAMHRTSWIVGLLLTALVPELAVCGGPRLGAIDSFACFYATGHTDALSRYKLVVIQPENYTAADIASIKKSGTIVLGYTSVGETDEASGASYYLDKNRDGKPDQNTAWSSYYVDARSEAWQSKILNQIVPQILAKGCDGLFLDTVDTVDVYPETGPGMASLIGALRAKYAAIPLISNRGFAILESIVPHLDGILFEDFTTSWDTAKGRSNLHTADEVSWADKTLAKIRSTAPSGFLVLALDYADPNDPKVAQVAVDHAKAAGLTYSIASGALTNLPSAGGR